MGDGRPALRACSRSPIRDLVARLAVADATVNKAFGAPYGVTVRAVCKHLQARHDAGLTYEPRRSTAARRVEMEVFDLGMN